MLRFALGLALALAAPPAAAQSWETFAAGSRIGAGICPRAMSHAGDGTFCLSVICDGGEGPFLDLSFLAFDGLPERADIRFVAAGTPFGAVAEARADGRVTAYRIELSPDARDALRRGLRTTATVSEEGGEPLLELVFPLSGSSIGIERAGALCNAVRARDGGGTGAGESVYDAEAVEAELVDRDLALPGGLVRLAADGSATRREGSGGAPRTGRWHVQGTDRVCLTFEGGATSCLRFYREDGALMVRGGDAGAGESLGAVEIGAAAE